MCNWILENLGQNYPLHLSRFFPHYKLDRLPPTPISTLIKFKDTAIKAGIHYVYIGNVAGSEAANTYCHNCKKLLIQRSGYRILLFDIVENRCKYCKSIIPGHWKVS